MTTRAKRKQKALTTEELEEQLNKLREEELHCNAMRQQIREHMAMLQQDQALALSQYLLYHSPTSLPGFANDPSSLKKTCTPTKKASTG